MPLENGYLESGFRLLQEDGIPEQVLDGRHCAIWRKQKGGGGKERGGRAHRENSYRNLI